MENPKPALWGTVVGILIWFIIYLALNSYAMIRIDQRLRDVEFRLEYRSK